MINLDSVLRKPKQFIYLFYITGTHIFTVLQIRRDNKDNLGIISHISP